VHRETQTGADNGLADVLANHGMVRIRAHIPAGTRELTGLRVLLIADVLARVAELQGAQAFIAWTFAEQHSDQQAIVDRAAGVLNIHPPTARTNALVSSASKADVHVTAGTDAIDGSDGVNLAVASVHDGGSGTGLGDLLAGPDPLVIRFALLSCRLRESAELTEDTLASGRETLGQWRSQVARWAESPSRPVPQHIMAAYRTAFDGADTAAVVTLLHTVAADEAMAPGAKFESFLYADRVLGLDLPSAIGRI
jgi:hypothetical protein